MKKYYLTIFVSLITPCLSFSNSETNLKKTNQEPKFNKEENLRKSKKKSSTPAAFQTEEVKEMMRKLSVIDSQIPDSDPRKLMLFNQVSPGLANMGAFKEAEEISLRAMKIVKKMSNEDSEALLDCKRSLAKIYLSSGDYKKAYDLLLDCIQHCERLIAKAKKNTDSKDLEVFNGIITTLYSQISDLSLNLGRFDKANNSSLKSLQLARLAPPSMKDFLLESALGSRAGYLMQMGSYPEAEILLKEQKDVVLKLCNTAKNNLTPQNKSEIKMMEGILFQSLLKLHNLYVMIGNLNAAKDIEAELDNREGNISLKKINSLSAMYYSNKAIRKYLSGEKDGALKDAEYYLKYTDDFIDSALCMIEDQRLAWQKANLDFSLPVALCNTDRLAEYIVKWKGVVIDSLINDRKSLLSNDPSKYNSSFYEINVLKQKLFQMQMNAYHADSFQSMKKIEDSIVKLQRKNASDSLKIGSDSMNKPSLAKIREMLADDTIVVEYITYRDLPDIKFGEEQLGAMIISKGPPAWIPLGNLKDAKKSYDHFRSLLASKNIKDEEFSSSLNILHQKIWNKVAESIPNNISRVYISPDSFLNFLPFACLLDENGLFLAQKYLISYLGSSREILKKSTAIKGNQISFFANPKFDLLNNTSVQNVNSYDSTAINEYNKIYLAPLPGANVEVENLTEIFKSYGWNSSSLTGADASKKELFNIQAPTILHLATHGFYLGRTTAVGDAQSERGMTVSGTSETQAAPVHFNLINPMIQSGIALAGAQSTLELWRNGKAPDPSDDGILTAEDVCSLNLNGTWLVTLSACESGVGEARSGEGVFGLRRAFMMAGAQNLLMTLWPVSDITTPQIMYDFYDEFLKTKSAPNALANVQKNWLLKLKVEKGIFEAVREAGPFAMVVMSNPNFVADTTALVVDNGLAAYETIKSSKVLSFETALSKADAGDAYAQAVVSIYYGLGMGCAQDIAKSKEYVMFSAKQQNPLGIYRLAEMREAGEGMDQSSEQALQLMKKAKRGLEKLSSDPYALTALAKIYERENPDSPKIRELLTKAAEMGYEPAQTKLSQINQ